MVSPRYLKLFIVLFSIVFFSRAEDVFAENSCDNYGSPPRMRVEVFDETTGQEWGQTACEGAVQSLNVTEAAQISFPGPNYADRVFWSCEDVRGNGKGTFIIEPPDGCFNAPAAVVLHPPSGYECTTWQWTDSDAPGGGASGGGCQAEFFTPDNNYGGRVFMNMRPIATPTPPPPTPTPTPTLACPGNMTRTCGAGGTTVTYSWSSVPGAVNYHVRSNATPWTDWPTGPGDSYRRVSTTSVVMNIIPNNVYGWSVEPLRTTTEVPNFANACHASTSFSCPGSTPTSTRTPTPTRTPTVTPTRIPTPTPNPVCQDFSITPLAPVKYSTTPSINFTWYYTAPVSCWLLDEFGAENNVPSVPSGGRHRCSVDVPRSWIGQGGGWTYTAGIFTATGWIECSTDDYCMDGLSPNQIGGQSLTCSYNGTNYDIQYNYDPFVDRSCAGLNTTGPWGTYHAQISNASSFASILNNAPVVSSNDDTWQNDNTATAGINEGLNSYRNGVAPGTYYARVRARDAVDNQTGWPATPATLQVNAANCGVVSTFCGDTGVQSPNSVGAGGGGLTNDGNEECDSGASSANGCNMDLPNAKNPNAYPCSFARCGDGHIQNPNNNGETEVCDEGVNNGVGGYCDANCQLEPTYNVYCPL